jgi:hypothetical protein
MNIKENYYIYQFKQLNGLIEEQKIIKENNNQNSMFDIVIRCSHRSITGKKDISTLQQNSASKHSKKETNRHHSKVGMHKINLK